MSEPATRTAAPARPPAPDGIARRGLLLVLSSPSGAGKTTLARRLLQHDPSLSMSVSLTTRPMREGERDGHDYHFVDAAGFAAARDAGELLEWAEVFGNFYGTPRGPVMAQLEAGRDMLFDVDWQGAQQMAERAPEDLVRVFILPPSVASLEERLRKRNQDPAEVVQARMAKAMDEIAHWHEYDYVIVNEELDVSLQGLSAILDAERLRRTRQRGLAAFVDAMQTR